VIFFYHDFLGDGFLSQRMLSENRDDVVDPDPAWGYVGVLVMVPDDRSHASEKQFEIGSPLAFLRPFRREAGRRDG
jgi:hypothetical protein